MPWGTSFGGRAWVGDGFRQAIPYGNDGFNVSNG